MDDVIVYGDYKRKFFERETKANKNLSSALFRSTYQYEMRAEKDICYMSYEEIVRVLHQLDLKESTCKQYLISLRRYLDWCVENGVVKNNVLRCGKSLGDIVYEVSDIVSAFVTPQVIEIIWKKIPVYSNRSLARAILYCYYWGLWDGDNQNLYHLSTDDIQNNTIRLHNGKIMDVPQYVVDSLRRCASMEVYAVGGGDNARLRKYIELMGQTKHNVFRGYGWKYKSNPLYQNKRIEEYGAQALQYTRGEYTAQDIVRSGLFYRTVVESVRDGLDIYNDLQTDGELSYDGKYNQYQKYNKVLNTIGSSMCWREFKKQYRGWIRFLDGVTGQLLIDGKDRGKHPWEIEL